MNSDTSDERIAALLDFWFEGDPADCERPAELMKKWFSGSPEQDLSLKQQLGQLADAAATGDLNDWARTPRGRLALIILLDQLPRSIHRGAPEAFACDRKALDLCLDGLDRAEDRNLHPLERIFFCMPLQHAESEDVQARSTQVFEELADSVSTEPLASVLRRTTNFAYEHRDIVARFGRFPHRNEALGRESTPAEIEYLRSGGPTYGQ